MDTGTLGSEINAATRSRLEGVPLTERAARAEKNPLSWLVSSTVLEGAIHVLHGDEESFKTTLTLQMMEALNLGGRFLLWDVPGGKRVGIAELEMTERVFNDKASKFLRACKGGRVPEILTLHEKKRREILRGKTAYERIKILADWAEYNKLDFLAVDSAAKLFPPGADPNSQSTASDVFSHLQSVGCAVWIIAHDRKYIAGQEKARGNQEIAGSGRFAQDPDLILEMYRRDKRSPEAMISWGKMRVDFKPDDLPVFFDAVGQRLVPIHPLLHLLPATREELLKEAKHRFGWGERWTDTWIDSMAGVVTRETTGHKATFRPDPEKALTDLLQRQEGGRSQHPPLKAPQS